MFPVWMRLTVYKDIFFKISAIVHELSNYVQTFWENVKDMSYFRCSKVGYVILKCLSKLNFLLLLLNSNSCSVFIIVREPLINHIDTKYFCIKTYI